MTVGEPVGKLVGKPVVKPVGAPGDQGSGVLMRVVDSKVLERSGLSPHSLLDRGTDTYRIEFGSRASHAAGTLVAVSAYSLRGSKDRPTPELVAHLLQPR